MMGGFTVGLLWAWSQGLALGAAGEATTYPVKLGMLVLYTGLGVYLFARPTSRLSLDGRLRGA